MHPLIYDVAVSIDGYISGPGGDISAFAHDGPMVEAYMARLGTYSACVMGRATYEFGYRFGMEPGQNPYPNMASYVLSSGISLPEGADVTVIRQDVPAAIDRIKAQADGPVYLCGGGHLAGALARAGQIDRLRLKRQPIVLGGGVRLFGEAGASPRLRLIGADPYPDGGLFQDYAIG